MKKLFLIVTLGLVGIAQAQDYDIRSSTGTFFLDLSTFTSIPVPLAYGWDLNNETVLYIDSDGDIFLRGKWIGKDSRLPEIFGMKKK